jgi:O-antigen/teichoic acid export membrane protein
MSKGTKDILLERIREGAGLSLRERVILTAYLSVPAMLAQLMQILMEYIDAAMVGSLGATASASIGLVSSSTWLMGGLCNSVGAGFCVQVAHQIGAKRNQEARNILRIGLVASLAFSILLCAIGLVISPYLPHWLGGSPEIVDDASIYFAIFTGMIPLMMLLTLSTGMLRSVGNVKVPSILLSVACVLDVVFNSIFIFHFHMGVLGAAIGSALAYFLIFPLTYNFLSTYQVSDMVVNQISLSSYISSFLGLVFTMGLFFEMPIVAYFFARIGVLRSSLLRRWRKVAFVVVLTAAAFITPSTDIFTMCIVALPLWLLYEFSIVVARKAEPAEDASSSATAK